MNCAAIDRSPAPRPGPCVVLGFGNAFRRDDGLGPWIIGRLEERLGGRPGVRLATGFHFDPGLVDDLSEADRVVLIDACVQELPGGWTWEELEPRRDAPTFLHSCQPGFLLWLLEQVYDRRPQAWLISVQGDSFEHGRGLSPRAEQRALEVISALEDFLAKEERYGRRA